MHEHFIPTRAPTPTPQRSSTSGDLGQPPRTFTRITQVDGGVLWCNLALLLPASVLPFPAAQPAFAMVNGTDGDKVNALLIHAVIIP